MVCQPCLFVVNCSLQCSLRRSNLHDLELGGLPVWPQPCLQGFVRGVRKAITMRISSCVPACSLPRQTTSDVGLLQLQHLYKTSINLIFTQPFHLRHLTSQTHPTTISSTPFPPRQHRMSLRALAISLLLALSSTLVHARSGGYAASCPNVVLSPETAGIFLNTLCNNDAGVIDYSQIRVRSSRPLCFCR
jgi:hypothetical protein